MDVALNNRSCRPSMPTIVQWQDGLLAMVGLPPSAVRNVLMHKDIVPRAFACDYRLVADLLRRVNEAFREHACLSGPQRVVRLSAALAPASEQSHQKPALEQCKQNSSCWEDLRMLDKKLREFSQALCTSTSMAAVRNEHNRASGLV